MPPTLPTRATAQAPHRLHPPADRQTFAFAEPGLPATHGVAGAPPALGTVAGSAVAQCPPQVAGAGGLARTATGDVFGVLARSRAALERQAHLGDGLHTAQWRNAHDHTHYRQPGHHTVSVYLQGGHDTRFVGDPAACQGAEGGPGRFCVLPAEHESAWAVGQPFRFVHLYVSPLAWADRVVRLLDAEPCALTLQQQVFGLDPLLHAWALRVQALDWACPLQRLAAQVASHAALDHLLLQAARPRQRESAQRVRGGLSAVARRRVLEAVDAALAQGQTPGLAELAGHAHLSEYHFARMFRVSLGCSVADWVAQRRLVRARALLQAPARGTRRLSLDDVAQRSGFAHASHLVRAFRQHLGVTPGGFRQWWAATGQGAPGAE